MLASVISNYTCKINTLVLILTLQSLVTTSLTGTLIEEHSTSYYETRRNFTSKLLGVFIMYVYPW